MVLMLNNPHLFRTDL